MILNVVYNGVLNDSLFVIGSEKRDHFALNANFW